MGLNVTQFIILLILVIICIFILRWLGTRFDVPVLRDI